MLQSTSNALLTCSRTVLQQQRLLPHRHVLCLCLREIEKVVLRCIYSPVQDLKPTQLAGLQYGGRLPSEHNREYTIDLWNLGHIVTTPATEARSVLSGVPARSDSRGLCSPTIPFCGCHLSESLRLQRGRHPVCAC